MTEEDKKKEREILDIFHLLKLTSFTDQPLCARDCAGAQRYKSW